MITVKKIPTGIKSFRKLREENYYFVDKTLMIKDFLERGSEVTLITRPRRFGKTINMSLILPKILKKFSKVQKSWTHHMLVN